MPERREDGTWTGVPSEGPLPGDPVEPVDFRDLLDPEELLLALEVARIALTRGGISVLCLDVCDLDVDLKVLTDLGVRLEHVLNVDV
jgi:hypothetical protein